jgi:hypothetical protein
MKKVSLNQKMKAPKFLIDSNREFIMHTYKPYFISHIKMNNTGMYSITDYQWLSDNAPIQEEMSKVLIEVSEYLANL